MVKIMTNSSDREDSLHQGQQDDFFNADLAAARHHQDKSAATDEKYRDQGQQDDYFDVDLATAANHSPDRAAVNYSENDQSNNQPTELG